ncbi:2-C-methyl-D-erythritol 4-phosphate cytidylyltransferase [hydrothermal vent metagenome]|uniref:2-C-methyl-D-erythritol 4-phosphate cytidylyltransferase n=1 Tax=hydrothermal vent metagenome TaxID=652676 RepID=A0A3B1DJV3_9ZZZZ
MKVQAIVVAAGSGTRLKASVPKPLVLITGKPILVYTLEIFQKSALIEGVILVVPSDYIVDFKQVVEQYPLDKVVKIVVGGAMRADSVCNGLGALDEDTDVVVIHDGARPLVDQVILEDAIRLGEKHEAIVVAVPVKPTIKRVDIKEMVVEATIDRKMLWEIQTPQVFQKEVILAAHRQADSREATDDAFLVEQMGQKVKVLQGDYRNIKITTQEDLIVAEVLLYEKDQ